MRNNWALQEVVATFLAARPKALEVARREVEAERVAARPGKRKRLVVDEEEDGAGRVTRRKSQRLAASQTSQAEAIEIEDDAEEDGDFEPEQVLDDGLVECPLGCGKRMAIEAVEPHLDRCEDEKKQASMPKARLPLNGFGAVQKSSKQQEPRPQDRLSELNYSMIKETALRKKFTELGIPNWGSKQLMVKRHTEWVNLWNANCDSNRPRTTRQLLHDLETWERTQGGRAATAQGQSNGVMRKDFDGAGWQNKHQDEFSRLIAEARKKKAASTKPETETAKGDEPSNPPVEAPAATESTSHYFTSDNPPSSGALQHPEPTVSNTQKQHPATEATTEAAAARAEPAPAPEPDVQATDFAPPGHQQLRRIDSDELPARFYDDGSLKRVPMFALPQQPVRDVDESGSS